MMVIVSDRRRSKNQITIIIRQNNNSSPGDEARRVVYFIILYYTVYNIIHVNVLIPMNNTSREYVPRPWAGRDNNILYIIISPGACNERP